MLVYGLRLLVALITFGFGVAASWLLGSGTPAKSENYVVVSAGPVVAEAQPRRTECFVSRTQVVLGGLLQTKTIDKLSPAYPHYGKVAGVSGKVSVKVEIDEDGRVTKAKAVTGYGMLPEAAEKDALNTRFPPTRLSGQPVRVAGEILYNFVLD